MKLFFVEGIRHHAIVVASDEKEAEILARKAHGEDENSVDSRVLYGSVGEWEFMQAVELKLPEGYQITKKE